MYHLKGWGSNSKDVVRCAAQYVVQDKELKVDFHERDDGHSDIEDT